MLPEGTILGDYRISKVLGTGGFGITYLAVDEKLGLTVAVKEAMPSDIAYHDGRNVLPKSRKNVQQLHQFLGKFLDEARLAVRVNHANVVHVLRFFEANSTAYMVMQYEEGRDLKDFLDKLGRPFTENEIRALARPLLEGLQAVHESGMIHRDIKPGNIFLRNRDNSPVLLDFGAARVSDATHFTTILTDGYAPLEQYQERGRQGSWTDIYAVAAVLYRLLFGKKPPSAPERQIADTLIPAAIAGRGHINDSLARAIDWGLTVDGFTRPQTVAQWAKALDLTSETAAPVLAPQAGGRYTNWRILGRGGVASVYRALDTELECPVVIKLLLPDIREKLAADPERLKQVRRDILLAQNVQSDYLATTYNIFDGPEGLGAVSELVDGIPLAVWLNRHQDDLVDTAAARLECVNKLAQALSAAHRRLAHRDLRPQNIFLRGGRVYDPVVIDLGLSSAVSHTVHRGVVAFPWQYDCMAPEQFERPDSVDARSDLFALGIIGYLLLTGRLPSVSLRDVQRTGAPPRGAVEAPSVYNPAVTPALDRLILKLLNYEPEHRFQRADEVLNLLNGPGPYLVAPDKVRSSKESGSSVSRFEGAVDIPGGEYYFGARMVRANEPLAKKVRLSPFKIDAKLVTNRDYDRFIRATGRPVAPLAGHPLFGAPDHPVVGISHSEALRFAEWAGGTLPTEAQWECAARGGNKLAEYPWGNVTPDEIRANLNNVAPGTTPVAAFPGGRNSFGLWDMSGNVWEWCADTYDERFRPELPADTLDPVNKEPLGPKVLRGGGFLSPPEHGRCAYRSGAVPSSGRNDIGFRVVYPNRI
ncbi:MAG: bifunctional serine/threonine-protein kinase/formylglycine-generating enzyme family protein [Rhodospirillaceae bacterium]